MLRCERPRLSPKRGHAPARQCSPRMDSTANLRRGAWPETGSHRRGRAVFGWQKARRQRCSRPMIRRGYALVLVHRRGAAMKASRDLTLLLLVTLAVASCQRPKLNDDEQSPGGSAATLAGPVMRANVHVSVDGRKPN